MGTNDLQITLHDSPSDAPTYQKGEFQAANLTTARVVGMGTKAGNPTVDLIFEDSQGQKYVAMITGGLLQNLAGCIEGVRQRTLARLRSEQEFRT